MTTCKDKDAERTLQATAAGGSRQQQAPGGCQLLFGKVAALIMTTCRDEDVERTLHAGAAGGSRQQQAAGDCQRLSGEPGNHPPRTSPSTFRWHACMKLLAGKIAALIMATCRGEDVKHYSSRTHT